jgi:hypothetical protein
LLFYLLLQAGWHFSQVTTLGIQHADVANATNGTTSFLEQVGGHRFPQELSRENNVGAGEGRRTGPRSPTTSLAWDMQDSFPWSSRALATTREGSFGVRHVLHPGE